MINPNTSESMTSHLREEVNRVNRADTELTVVTRAEVIVLGCLGMAGYGLEIESKLNVKVLDPLAVALKVAEAMVDLGLVHSRIGLFSPPPPKPFKQKGDAGDSGCVGWSLIYSLSAIPL